MNRFTLFALCVVVGVPRCALLSDNRPAFQIKAGQRQLLLDNHGVEKLSNLTRTMHSPVKRGAVIEPDRPWESLLQIRCAAVWDAERMRYKIWLISAGPGFSNTRVGYAESRDGLNWTKPILNQVQRDGSKKNNLLAVGSLLENVVYDPHDPDPATPLDVTYNVNWNDAEDLFKGFTAPASPTDLIVSSDSDGDKFNDDTETHEFASGEVAKQFSIKATDGDGIEGFEMFRVRIRTTSGGPYIRANSGDPGEKKLDEIDVRGMAKLASGDQNGVTLYAKHNEDDREIDSFEAGNTNRGIHYNDVEQGSYGDCYFLAAVAVAEAD